MISWLQRLIKIIATDADFAMWEAEENAVPLADEMAALYEERAADKACIARLEKRLHAVEEYLWTHKGVDEQLGWAKRSLEWLDERGDEQDERVDGLSVRLEGLEDYLGMPIGDCQGIRLYDGQDVSLVHRMRCVEAREERDDQLLAAYQMTDEERQRRESNEDSEDEGSGDEVSRDEASKDEPWLSSAAGSRSPSPTADIRMEGDGPIAMPTAPPHSTPTPPTPPPPPLLAIQIIPATPESSLVVPQMPVPDVPIAGPQSPPADGAAQASATVMPPPLNWDAIPAPQWEEVRPPASPLLTVPATGVATPNSPRRSRSRSPSPGPLRRSPRLQSPLASTPSAAPTAQSTNADSMDIDH